MGYFANGSEGDFYERAICQRCIHYDDSQGFGNMCPVWELHLLYNYAKEGSETEIVLNMLIPRQGTTNDLCNMWKPAKAEWEGHGDAYREWAGLKGMAEEGAK